MCRFVYYISWTNKVGHTRKQVWQRSARLSSLCMCGHVKVRQHIFVFCRWTEAAATRMSTITSTQTGAHNRKPQPANHQHACSNFGIYNVTMVLATARVACPSRRSRACFWRCFVCEQIWSCVFTVATGHVLRHVHGQQHV